MKEKSTDEMDKLLAKVKTNKVGQFLEQNKDFMANEEKQFTYYMKDVLASKDRKLYYNDWYTMAGLSVKYGAKILNMEQHTKDRDVIIRFCIAGRFTLDETNRALKLYGMRALYSKDARDVCIITALHNRVYDFCEIDDQLEAQGLEILTKPIKEDE